MLQRFENFDTEGDFKTYTLNEQWQEFENHRLNKINQPAVDKTLNGEYPAEMFGEPVWQVSNLTETWWTDAHISDYELYSSYEEYSTRRSKIGLKTRLFLQFKESVTEVTERVEDEDRFVNIHHFGKIAILDGQPGLPETENNLYKWLVKRNHEVLVITDLFSHPERIKALKLFDIDTIVLGTTGIYRDKINKAVVVFSKLKWLPKNAIFTMGEDYFHEFLEAGVKGYKIYPMSSLYQSDEVFITEL